MPQLAVATVVAKNYLSFARVLARSLIDHHADVPFFVLLSDEVDGYFDPAVEPFRLVRPPDLGIPDLRAFQFRYDRKQAAVASKPYLMSHLLDRGFERVIFLDPDMLVLGGLESLFSQVGEHAVVLLPHLLAPLGGREGVERELNILLSGVYNGGCLGVSARPMARAFLEWWQVRVHEHCRHDLAEGLYFDQRWLDLAPVFFHDVHIFRDPGYNVAHWNLPERTVGLEGGGLTVNGRPCRVFHFSGFEPDRPAAVTRYSSRLAMSGVGPVAELFRRYASLLEAAGHRESEAWPYAYGHFDNGVPISDLARRIYQDLGPSARRFGDPFETARRDSFFRWSSGRRARRWAW